MTFLYGTSPGLEAGCLGVVFGLLFAAGSVAALKLFDIGQKRLGRHS